MPPKLIRKFNYHQAHVQIKFNKVSDKSNIEEFIEKGMFNMVRKVKKEMDYRKGDLMRATIVHENLNHPISTHLSKDFQVNNIIQHFNNIITSDQNIDIEDCRFDFQVINMPRGGARQKLLNIAEDKRTKKSITLINNNDNMCCARAIITALTYQTNIIFDRELSDNEIIYIRKGRKLQKSLAIQLCNNVSKDPYEMFTLKDILDLENFLNIQINVKCAENFNTKYYKGDEEAIKIYLYKNKNHFDVINSLTGFIVRSVINQS